MKDNNFHPIVSNEKGLWMAVGGMGCLMGRRQAVGLASNPVCSCTPLRQGIGY